VIAYHSRVPQVEWQAIFDGSVAVAFHQVFRRLLVHIIKVKPVLFRALQHHGFRMHVANINALFVCLSVVFLLIDSKNVELLNVTPQVLVESEGLYIAVGTGEQARLFGFATHQERLIIHQPKKQFLKTGPRVNIQIVY
jgi:hypothetical protein